MSGPNASERGDPMHTSAPPAAQKPPAGQEDVPGVAEWLAGRGVFITGGTGFLGQLLVEKILRSCPDVDAIFLLVRDKKGDTPQRRVDRLLEDPLFDLVRGRRDKLVLVPGDLSEPGLGLKPEDRATLLRRASVVLHCAATLRFDSPLRPAAHINVRATGEVLRLARHMRDLQAFVHLSTAYANCPHQCIEERVYKPRLQAEQLLNIIDALDDSAIDRITPVIMEPWPNTYCFTKAIAEDLVLREGKGLPVCVMRPSMVVGTTKEPVPGWINNINGPAGIVVGVGIGLLRTLYLKDGNYKPDMIPADLVVNATLASAWKTAHSGKGSALPVTGSEGEEIPVYNCVSSTRNPITWDEFIEYNFQHGEKYPSEHCLWYYCFLPTSSLWVCYILRILVHLFPALLVDTFLRLTGRKPQLWKAYKKIHKFLDLTAYFGEKQWLFPDNKTKWLWNEMKESDKQIFPFNIEELDWRDNIRHLVPGLRMYFLKDPLHTVEKAKKKYLRLKIFHYMLLSALALLFLRMLWWILSLVFS